MTDRLRLVTGPDDAGFDDEDALKADNAANDSVPSVVDVADTRDQPNPNVDPCSGPAGKVNLSCAYEADCRDAA
jgi:hypothetical protein